MCFYRIPELFSIIPFSQYVKERISILDLTELICLKSVYSVFVPSDSYGLQIRWNGRTAGNASNTHSGQSFTLYVIGEQARFSVYRIEVLSALLYAVNILVAHVHPPGHAAPILFLGNELVEGVVGKERATKTLKRSHLPISGDEVESIAVAVRRGGRAVHHLVQFRASIAGRNIDAHFA